MSHLITDDVFKSEANFIWRKLTDPNTPLTEEMAIGYLEYKLREFWSSKNKCSHGIEHKEVLGTTLCVCCVHCQKENEGLKKEIESLRETVRLQSLERWEWSEKKTKLIREGADAEIRVLNKEIEDLRRK